MDTRDPQSLLDAAERAANAGDHAAAEARLREALALQEARLGPMHPDIANTLNNLGVLCDIAGRGDEAELAYRRAYAIFSATMDPTHPCVATSRKNLQDFYVSRDRQADAAALDAPMSGRRGPRSERGIETAPAASRARRLSGRPAVLGRPVLAIVAAILVLAAGVLAVRAYLGSAWSSTDSVTTFDALPGSPERTLAAERPDAAVVDRSSALAESTAPSDAVAHEALAPEPSPAALPAAPSPEPAPLSAPASASPSAPASAPLPAPLPAPTVRAASETPSAAGVVDARLCSTLATGRGWACGEAGEAVGAGSLFFYTRVKSPSATTIEHRWYQGSELRRTVELRIGASGNEGYRTYSRQRLTAADAGDWRVELRTSTGTLLHEARFVVR